MAKLVTAQRVRWLKTVPRYVFYADDYPVMEITNQWIDTQGASGKTYAVQTATKIVERCLLMTTDPGDLVFDPTCGSGTDRIFRGTVGTSLDYLATRHALPSRWQNSVS